MVEFIVAGSCCWARHEKWSDAVNHTLSAQFWPVIELAEKCMSSKNYPKEEDNLQKINCPFLQNKNKFQSASLKTLRYAVKIFYIISIFSNCVKPLWISGSVPIPPSRSTALGQPTALTFRSDDNDNCSSQITWKKCLLCKSSFLAAL